MLLGAMGANKTQVEHCWSTYLSCVETQAALQQQEDFMTILP